MDVSLLLLATPVMPPVGPAPGVPMPPGEGVVGVVPVVGRGPVAGLLWIGVGVWPGRWAVCEPLPGVAAVPWPCNSGMKSLLVIGSLYFLRRNFWSTSRSRFGGNALAYFFWKSPMARAYCSPRNTNSASFSRCIVC